MRWWSWHQNNALLDHKTRTEPGPRARRARRQLRQRSPCVEASDDKLRFRCDLLLSLRAEQPLTHRPRAPAPAAIFALLPSDDCSGEPTGATTLTYGACAQIENGFGGAQRVLYSGSCASTTMALYAAGNAQCSGAALSTSAGLPYASLSGQCTNTTATAHQPGRIGLSSSKLLCSVAAALRPSAAAMWLAVSLASIAALGTHTCMPVLP